MARMMNNISLNTPRSLAELQNIFTGHIRDPDHEPAPDDIPDVRMEVYRESIYLNIERMISNFFPVLKRVTPEDQWHAMIRDYLTNYRSHVPPYLKELGQEFLRYLQNDRNLDADPPYILELTHYEWIEFSLSIDQREIEWEGIKPDGDLLTGIPVLSPLVTLLSYRYPVHTISPDHLPEQLPDNITYLVVYRDRNYKIGFIELNPVTAQLLNYLQQDKSLSGQVLLEKIALNLNHLAPEVVVKGGQEIMQTLIRKDVILGTKIIS